MGKSGVCGGHSISGALVLDDNRSRTGLELHAVLHLQHNAALYEVWTPQGFGSLWGLLAISKSISLRLYA
eukprot:757175-Amphidinium_carterae.1